MSQIFPDLWPREAEPDDDAVRPRRGGVQGPTRIAEDHRLDPVHLAGHAVPEGEGDTGMLGGTSAPDSSGGRETRGVMVTVTSYTRRPYYYF